MNQPRDKKSAKSPSARPSRNSAPARKSASAPQSEGRSRSPYSGKSPSFGKSSFPARSQSSGRSASAGRASEEGKAPRKSASVPVRRKPAAVAAPRPEQPPRVELDFGACISRRAAERLRADYLWVYASDIETLAAPEGVFLIPVADNRGLLLGTALYSPQSQIALRVVSRAAIDEAAWLDLLEERLRAAIARRKPLLDKQTTAARLCFSEADEIPGLVVDKYGDLVILQLLAKGLDSAAVRERCVSVLSKELKPATILERPDPRIRELEGLSAPDLAPLWTKGAKVVTSAEFRLNGLVFHYDANSGQKTGAFLDQRANYAAAAEWAERLGATGRALDVCCYQGGFALHLARVCQKVTGIDASRASLEVAEENLTANRKAIPAEVDWVEGDAFQILREWSEAGEQFDAIVLDPPAFAKSRRAVEGALRGYKELNLRALKMLRPGGLLVACSCSHHVSLNDLESCVASAASDTHRRLRLLERRGAALDHPVILNLPETEYLKCVLFEVE